MAIKAGQKVVVSIDPRDAFGNKARIDGIPTWSITDPSLASGELSVDGMNYTVSSTGVVGSFDVHVAADADLSQGIHNLSGSVTIDVEAGEATDLGVHADPIVVDVAPTAIDTSTTDTAPVDTTTEAAPVDATTTDTAPVDAAAADTAPADTTATDTTTDTAPVDATTTDTAPIDAAAADSSAIVDDTTVDSPTVDPTVDPNQSV